MRTALLLIDFEDRFFSVSFQHAAREKYGAKFTNSNVNHIQQELLKLKENIQSGKHNEKHVGYDPTSEDVGHLLNLLAELIKRYKEQFALTAHPNPKLRNLVRQLREAGTKTSDELAKEALIKVLTLPQNPKQTRQQRIDAAAELKSMERALSNVQNATTTKGG
jgi:beta-phosphoglucomutase-like phosphatase (HAD superfamily)